MSPLPRVTRHQPGNGSHTLHILILIMGRRSFLQPAASRMVLVTGVVTELIPLRVTLSTDLPARAGTQVPSVWLLSPVSWAPPHTTTGYWQQRSLERQLVLPLLVSQCPAPCAEEDGFPSRSDNLRLPSFTFILSEALQTGTTHPITMLVISRSRRIQTSR